MEDTVNIEGQELRIEAADEMYLCLRINLEKLNS